MFINANKYCKFSTVFFQIGEMHDAIEMFIANDPRYE